MASSDYELLADALLEGPSLPEPALDELPQLCLGCDKPFVTAELSLGVPAICPMCMQREGFKRMLEWHAKRAEADEHIRRWVSLLTNVALALPDAPGELTQAAETHDWPTCRHNVPVVMCWLCRQQRSRGGPVDGNTTRRGETESANISFHSL